MDQQEAVELIAQADESERAERAERLIELMLLLGDESVGLSGQAAAWLFEDVKATWLYGYFTATVVTAHAFCLRQLSGLMLMLPDEPDLPDMIDSLEELAALCDARGLIGLELRAKLVALHDAASAYTTVGLHEQDLSLERRLIDAEVVGADDHPLLADARAALDCCVELLHRR